jgi:lambda family phage portal protein
MNNGYAVKFKKMCRNNIIGMAGIRLQGQVQTRAGEMDSVANNAIEAAWKDWSKRRNCDITERSSLVKFQRQAIDSLVDNGEYMFLILTDENNPYRMSLKMLDPVLCPPDYCMSIGEEPGSYVWNGIEFNEFGKPVAYYFIQGPQRTGVYSFGGRPLKRVPAENIIHGFEEILTGQTRGFPWLTSGIFNIQNLGEINLAALISVRSNATSIGTISKQFDDSLDEMEEISIKKGEYNVITDEVTLTPADIKTPDGNYTPFMKENLREIASGGDVSYHSLHNDYESVNYSSLRQSALSERDGWSVRQSDFAEAFLEEIYLRWLPLQLLTRTINLPASQLDRLKAHRWQPRRWQWVDPQKEMSANAKAIDYVTKSPSQVIREGGRDPQEVFQEWASDIETMRKLGIPEDKINFILSGGKSTNDAIIDEAGAASPGSE